jgi:hypothetical protein
MFGTATKSVTQKLVLAPEVSKKLPKEILVWVNVPGSLSLEEASALLAELTEARLNYDKAKAAPGGVAMINGVGVGTIQASSRYKACLEAIGTYFGLLFSEGPQETHWSAGEVAGLFSIFSIQQVYVILLSAADMVESYRKEVESHGNKVQW